MEKNKRSGEYGRNKEEKNWREKYQFIVSLLAPHLLTPLLTWWLGSKGRSTMNILNCFRALL